MKQNESSCSKEATFWEVSDDRQSTERSQFPNREIGTSSQNAKRITENPKESQADDDLIDIAENPYPSIKSFYFPPNPQEKDSPSMCPRKQTRATKDMQTLLRIDGELGPLQHKLNEITSKFRALNMTVPSLLSQRHYSGRAAHSSNVSGYYLHRTETLDRGSNINDVVYVLGKQVPAFVDRSSRESRVTESLPFHSLKSESVSLHQDPFLMKEAHSKGTSIGHSYLSKCVDRSTSNVTNNWILGENNSYVNLGGCVDNNPSGSLIPAVSSSCYRCFRNRSFDPRMPNTSFHFDQLEAVRSRNSFTRKSSTTPLTDQRGFRNADSLARINDYKNSFGSQYQDTNDLMNADKKSQPAVSDRYRDNCDKFQHTTSKNLPESYASSSTNPDIRVFSVNTQLCATVEKHYSGRIVAGGNSYFKEASAMHQRSMNDRSYIYKPN